MSLEQYTPADLNAPRYRPARFDILVLSNKSFYTSMKKQYPGLAKYSNGEIAKCIEFFNNAAAKEIINNRNGIRLSDGLGIIIAGSCKVSQDTANKLVDYSKSKELGVKVLHNNLHSDNLVAKVKYSNEVDGHMFTNHNMWTFDPSRNLARAVSEQFKNGNANNYIHFTTRKHISHLFRKVKIHKYQKDTVNLYNNLLDNHDEFDLN